MKNTLFPILLAGLTATPAAQLAAQDQPKPQAQRLQLQAAPAAGGRLWIQPGAFGAQLDLTDEQKLKIAELRKAHSAKTRELFQNKELSQLDKRDQYRDLNKDLNERIQALYTAEQKAKLAQAEKAQAQFQEQVQKLRIVFSDEQKAKLKELQTARMDAYKEVRELPQEERRGAYQKLSQQYQKNYQALLTKEQKENQRKLQELYQQRRPNGAGGAGGIRILPAVPLNGGLREIKPRQIQPRRAE